MADAHSPTRFFISYSKEDQPWAEWIAWEVESAGYSVVLQAWDFLPGENFVLKMHRAAAETERTILVLSPAGLASAFTGPEYGAAFAKDPSGWDRKLIPVRVAPCEVNGLLAQIIHIDLTSLPEDQARDRLIAGLNVQRLKPQHRPLFPAGSPKAARPMFPGEPMPIVPVTVARGDSTRSKLRLILTATVLLSIPITIASWQYFNNYRPNGNPCLPIFHEGLRERLRSPIEGSWEIERNILLSSSREQWQSIVSEHSNAGVPHVDIGFDTKEAYRNFLANQTEDGERVRARTQIDLQLFAPFAVDALEKYCMCAESTGLGLVVEFYKTAGQASGGLMTVRARWIPADPDLPTTIRPIVAAVGVELVSGMLESDVDLGFQPKHCVYRIVADNGFIVVDTEGMGTRGYLWAPSSIIPMVDEHATPPIQAGITYVIRARTAKGVKKWNRRTSNDHGCWAMGFCRSAIA